MKFCKITEQQFQNILFTVGSGKRNDKFISIDTKNAVVFIRDVSLSLDMGN